MHAAPTTPWFDSLRDMRAVQLETMQESATVTGRADPLQGILRARRDERNAYGVPVSDPHVRFSIRAADRGALANGDQLEIRNVTYTIVDIEPDEAGMTQLRLEQY